MGSILKTEIDDALLASLTERASQNGRTVEEEVNAILTDTLHGDRLALVGELRRKRARLAAEHGEFSDSTPLIREWRDR